MWLKKATEGSYWRWNVLYLDCGGRYTNLHVTKLHRTKYIQVLAKLGNLVDYININIVRVVIMHYNFIRCYHGGNLGKGYVDLCIISYNCMQKSILILK